MSLPPFDTSFKPQHTGSPNPDWRFGEQVGKTAEQKEWLEGEKAGWRTFNTAVSETDPVKQLYPLMLGGIVPRPVSFVSTISEDGIENLACYSWFQMVSFYPPTIMIAPANAPRLKDTCHNIRTTKEFTVNIISEAWVENANVCAIDAPEEVDEWPISGLTKEKSTLVKPARVKESAFSMECELLQAIDIRHPDYTGHPLLGDGMSTMIIGLVRYIHVRKDVLNEREVVDPTKLKPISRLGDISFARVGDMFRLPRFSWDDEKDKIEAAVGTLQ